MEIHVATDLWGRKHNLRLTFATWEVSLAELTVRVETAYRIESIALRPPQLTEAEVPPFMITAMTILVDEEASKWVDLVSAKQLRDRCQVFVFQPPHPFHSDSRDLIPLPREPLAATSAVHLEHYRAEAMALSRHLSETVGSGTRRTVIEPSSPPPPPPSYPSAARSNASPPRQQQSFGAASPSSGRFASLSSPVAVNNTNASGQGRRPPSPSRASPSRAQQRRESPHRYREGRAASPGRDYVRPEPLTTTHLDLAHELFGLMDRRGEGVVSVAEVKAALVTAGFVPAEVDRTGRLSGPRKRWEFTDWCAFCDENPTVLPVIAESRGIRLAGFKASNELPPGHSPGLSHPVTDNHDRNLSPLRSRPSAAERQKAVAERLHGGLASIVTAKDRERADFSHTTALLAQSPDRRIHSTTPTRGSRRQ